MSQTPHHTPAAEQPERKEPPTWQLGVPLFIAIMALIALVMFVYGFCGRH